MDWRLGVSLWEAEVALAVELNGLSKSFGDIRAVDDVSALAVPGQVTANRLLETSRQPWACACGLTGRQVQEAHMRLARISTTWDAIEIPSTLTGMNVGDVQAQAPGDRRDAALSDWARWVWSRWADHHCEIATLCDARAL